MARNQKINPIKSESERGVFLSLTLHRHRKSSDEDVALTQKFPVAVLVCYQGKNMWFRSGKTLTELEYARVLKASYSGPAFVMRKELVKFYDTIYSKVCALIDSDMFTLQSLKAAVLGKHNDTFNDLFLQRINELKSSGRITTAESYYYTYKKIVECTKGRTILFSDISQQFAIEFKSAMAEQGLSSTTQAIYLREFRAICNIALSKNLIKPSQYPFSRGTIVKIPQGKKRKDRFLPVKDILKLLEYDTEENRAKPNGALVCEALCLWLFSYLGNGMNLIDIALLTYNKHYFESGGNELSFVRRKTANTTAEEIVIYVPLIPILKDIISRYAAKPKLGARVFPQIVGSETDERRIAYLVNNYNSNIKDRLRKVCASVGIGYDISMTWARHSFKTNLIRKKVPDYYTEQAMGHSVNSVGDNYVGLFTYEDRFRYNSLLLEPDKEA